MTPRIRAKILRPPWRAPVLAVSCAVALGLAYALWTPGVDLRDGRHDRGRNAIWLQHAWLGDDAWFAARGWAGRVSEFRTPARVAELARHLRAHGVRDVFPHVAPTSEDGRLPGVDAAQVERFLDAFSDMRVMPWIGGALGVQAFPPSPEWRERFARTAGELVRAHPRLAGVHVNIEPCTSGSPSFLATLDAVRAELPAGKLLSVAAYPPPTPLHPYEEVHWDAAYYAEVAARADQIVPMMYDTALGAAKPYIWLMSGWTEQVLRWSAPREVLLGVPAYDDAGTGYHDPEVESLANALAGVHAGLSRFERLPDHYQGVAIYCEWETDATEWQLWTDRYLSRRDGMAEAVADGTHSAR